MMFFVAFGLASAMLGKDRMHVDVHVCETDVDTRATKALTAIVKSAHVAVSCHEAASVVGLANLIATLPHTHIGEPEKFGGVTILECALTAHLGDQNVQTAVKVALDHIRAGGRRRGEHGDTDHHTVSAINPDFSLDVQILIEQSNTLLKYNCLMDSVLYHLTDFYSGLKAELNAAEIEYAHSWEVPGGLVTCKNIRSNPANLDAIDAISDALHPLTAELCYGEHALDSCLTVDEINRLEAIESMASHLVKARNTPYLGAAMGGWSDFIKTIPLEELYEERLEKLDVYNILKFNIDKYFSTGEDSEEGDVLAKVNAACEHMGWPTLARAGRSVEHQKSAREVLLELLEKL